MPIVDPVEPVYEMSKPIEVNIESLNEEYHLSNCISPLMYPEPLYEMPKSIEMNLEASNEECNLSNCTRSLMDLELLDYMPGSDDVSNKEESKLIKTFNSV